MLLLWILFSNSLFWSLILLTLSISLFNLSFSERIYFNFSFCSDEYCCTVYWSSFVFFKSAYFCDISFGDNLFIGFYVLIPRFYASDFTAFTIVSLYCSNYYSVLPFSLLILSTYLYKSRIFCLSFVDSIIVFDVFEGYYCCLSLRLLLIASLLYSIFDSIIDNCRANFSDNFLFASGLWFFLSY